MAPRGRIRKRTSRMNAAVDHMTAYGFDKFLVQKIVKQLLKEYGGDDGWTFIEDSSYKELIEAILRYQESNDEDTTQMHEGNERVEEHASQSTIGMPGTLRCNEAANTTVAEAASTELASTGNGNIWKDIQEDQTFNAVCHDGGNSSDQVHPSIVSIAPPTSSPYLVNHLPPATDHHSSTHLLVPSSEPPRTPCYGWIESDEEEQGDRIAEEPALRSNTIPSGNSIIGEMACSEVGSAARGPTDEDHCRCNVTGKSAVSSLPPRRSLVKPSGSNNSRVDHNSSAISSSKRVKLEPPSRFPCHGWLASDEEESDVKFMHLTPRKPSTFSY